MAETKQVISKRSFSQDEELFPAYLQYVENEGWNDLNNSEEREAVLSTLERELIMMAKLLKSNSLNNNDKFNYLFSFLENERDIKVFTPPTKLITSRPMVFLAGPIRGVHNWRKRAIDTLLSTVGDIIVLANPKREVFEYTDEVYISQVKWETTALNRSAKKGGILFWIPKRDEDMDDYGRTTRIELGRWVAEYGYNKFPISIGIEDGFSSKRYIVEWLSDEFPELVIHDNLPSTCMAMSNQIINRFNTNE